MKKNGKIAGIVAFLAIIGVLMAACPTDANNELPVVGLSATPEAGGVPGGTLVELTSSTEGAEIWYTVDGSVPAKNGAGSTLYTVPFPVNASMTVKAIAVKAGMTSSRVLELAYTVLNKAATPTASPKAGAVLMGTEVRLSNASNGSMWYTLDGSEPSVDGEGSIRYIYTDRIPINGPTTIKAIAVGNNLAQSDVMTASYTIMAAATPVAAPGAGEIAAGKNVKLTSATDGAEIWYTVDGSVPAKDGAGSTLYTAPFPVNAAVVIKAIAVKENMLDSEVLEAGYTLLPPGTVSVPLANPASGAVPANTEITLETATVDAQIYYTLDGSVPGETSELYTANNKPVITETALTLKAIAVKAGMENSAVMEVVYTILPPEVAARPMAIPSGGAVAANREITLQTATEGAAIYYTVDGTIPTTGSALYNADKKPRVLKDNFAIKAIAVKEGMTDSEVLSASYTINTITSDTGIDLVQISAGKFIMGSPGNEPKRAAYEIQHEVTLTKDFYMGAYEVTQAQYKAVMGGNNPSMFPGDDFPVERISWYTALVFCNKLSMQEGLTPVYRIDGETDPAQWGTIPAGTSGTEPTGVAKWNTVEMVAGANGYRMPTEAEWEYACRAGTTTAFNWGSNTINTNQANFDGSGGLYNGSPSGTYRNKTTAVGTFEPNHWGLYDMHGNVREWCWDWFYTDYYSSEEAGTDPTGMVPPSNVLERVSRGGSWFQYGDTSRSAYRERNRFFWQTNISSVGMRLVRG